jgi:hypothetical protein
MTSSPEDPMGLDSKSSGSKPSIAMSLSTTHCCSLRPLAFAEDGRTYFFLDFFVDFFFGGLPTLDPYVPFPLGIIYSVIFSFSF